MASNYVTFDSTPEEKPIPANPTGEQKFQTCKFRSPEEIEKRFARCCGQSTIIKAFNCNKLNIFPLTLLNCISCNDYIKKDE